MQVNFDFDGFGKDETDPIDMIKLRSKLLNHLIDFNRVKLQSFGLPPVETWNVLMDDQACQHFAYEASPVIFDAVLIHHRGYGSVEALAALRVAQLRNERVGDVQVRYISELTAKRTVFITCEVWVNGVRDEWLETKRSEMKKRYEKGEAPT